MVLIPPVRPIFATLPEYPTLGESIAFQVNGLIVVFVALSSIWALLELIGVFFRRQAAARPATPAAAPTPAPDAPPLDQQTSPEVTAAIAAAIAAVLKQPHRIQTITTDGLAPHWAHEGRREIFGSHRIR